MLRAGEVETKMEKQTKSKNEYPIELQAPWLGFKDETKLKAFLLRKGELIRRDPLYEELTKVLALFPYEPLPVIPPEKKALYEKIPLLKGELEKKWNVEIDYTEEERYWANRAGQSYSGSDGPLIIRQGWFRGKDGKSYTLKAIPLKAWRLNPDTQETEKLKFNEVLPTDDKLLIEIDLNLMDRGEDLKFLKKNVLSLIARCLEQRKQEGRKPTIIGEPEKRSLLYHFKDKTFQNYLRWYDLHTQEKLSFRLIAAMGRSKEPSQFLEKIKQEKFKWGIPVKEEANVQKGVKYVYEAIHKTKYSPKEIEPIIEQYNCPKHGTECPLGCKYSKRWYAMFDRLMPWKPSKDLVLVEKSDEDESQNLDHPLDKINLQRLEGKRTVAIRPTQ